MHSNFLRAALATLVFASASVGFAQQPEATKVKLDTTFVFTRGDYGLPQNTDVSVFLVSPGVELPDWRFQASVPYIYLSGPASIVGNTGTPAPSRSTHGLGDLTLSAARKFETEPNGWGGEVGAKVKLPTADDAKGLGTGETDTIFQLDVYKRGGGVTPYATLGYQFLGSNASYPMKDGAFASAGIASEVATDVTLGVGGNWRQRTIAGGESGQELMAFVQRKFSERSRLQFFVLHGFTTASPDLAVGATFGLTF